MEVYHVLNRGVDKRIIFLDDSDRSRFVHDLYEFNDTIAAPDAYRMSMRDLRSPAFRKREMLVDIHGWVLMENHYHLLLSERIEGGLTKFIRKLNIGYAKYFNERYERSGTLFQGRTKKILIESHSHFLYILHYLHLNPLDFLIGAERWREGRIKSMRDALKHLRTYRWSSYLDYCGEHNIPSLITKELFSKTLGNVKAATIAFLKDLEPDSSQKQRLE
jgi:putative transposase